MAHEPVTDLASPVAGVILAGGLSRRMGGGDKSLIEIGGRPMLARVVERLRPQVSQLALSANGDQARFAHFNLPTFADPIEGYVGPLAGILGGMLWAANRRCPWIVTVPADTPFFPRDLVERFVARAKDSEIAVARSQGRAHSVVALWSIRLASDLRRWLEEPHHRKVDDWVKSRSHVEIDFAETEGFDPFFNVNTPQDSLIAAALAETSV